LIVRGIAINANGEESQEEIVHPNEEKNSDSYSDSKTETAG
jgi:hypothetical protein